MQDVWALGILKSCILLALVLPAGRSRKAAAEGPQPRVSVGALTANRLLHAGSSFGASLHSAAFLQTTPLATARVHAPPPNAEALAGNRLHLPL